MFVKEEELKEIIDILAFYLKGYEVWAFGSRVTGTNLKKFSDLDLAVITEKPLTTRQVQKIKDAFSISDLPFRVDIIDWSRTEEEFKAIIKQNYEVIQSI